MTDPMRFVLLAYFAIAVVVTHRKVARVRDAFAMCSQRDPEFAAIINEYTNDDL